MAGVGDLVQRTGDGQAQVEYSVAERSRGQVTLCMVCTVHKETRSVSVWFGLKIKVNGFLGFVLKTDGFGFPGLGLKTGSYDLVI
jgi:hypothetical protein